MSEEFGNANLIEISCYLEKKREQEFIQEYQKYLESLKIYQLEIEANFLLEQFSSQNFDHFFKLKVELLLTRIADLTDENFKKALLDLKNNLLSVNFYKQ